MKKREIYSHLPENLSSETLFTFTSKLEYLMEMITQGILPRYICERIPRKNKTISYIVPAKCFCDIPLGKIKTHLQWFGMYGIGINRTYLLKKGVSPLMYMHEKSLWINEIKDLKSYPTLPFLKRYYGDDFRLEKKHDKNGNEKIVDPYKAVNYQMKKRSFYDEREWRYVPKGVSITFRTDIKKIVDCVMESAKMNSEQKFNKDIITLNPEVINYIIIRSLKEFSKVTDMLKKHFKDTNVYEILISKILIADRVISDF